MTTIPPLKLIRRVMCVCCLLLVTVTTAHAYDADTHFWLTYYLARQVGYTQLESMQIASANISVDYDKDTNPFLNPTFDLQEARARLHAFPSTKTVKEFRAKVRATNPASKELMERAVDKYIQPLLESERQTLWKAALTGGNPGVYLHFYQDVFSHRGFTTRTGHTRLGHLPDFLASDEAKAWLMVQGTIERLKAFMVEYWPNRRPASPNMQQVKAVLEKFFKANACELISTYYDSWNWDSSKLDVLDLFTKDKLKKYLCRAPDPASVRRIVTAELKGEDPEVNIYDLNDSGGPRKVTSDRKLKFKTSDCSGSTLTDYASLPGEGIQWSLAKGGTVTPKSSTRD